MPRAGWPEHESAKPRDGDRAEYIGPDLGERDLPRRYGYLRHGTLGRVINIGGADEVWVSWDTGGVFRMDPEEFRLIADQDSRET